jgi:ParB-like chromosome segregation protein Spo0J
MTHQELIEQAEKAIRQLFSDTSVSQEETARSLKGLIEEIEIMLDALDLS